MLCNCGGKTNVIDTRQIPGSVRRQRRCSACRHSFYTVEVREAVAKPEVKPVAKPKEKPLAKAAVEVHRKRVEVRRINEDRKLNKVPDYFIEEEDY